MVLLETFASKTFDPSVLKTDRSSVALILGPDNFFRPPKLEIFGRLRRLYISYSCKRILNSLVPENYSEHKFKWRIRTKIRCISVAINNRNSYVIYC